MSVKSVRTSPSWIPRLIWNGNLTRLCVLDHLAAQTLGRDVAYPRNVFYGVSLFHFAMGVWVRRSPRALPSPLDS
jgi:hypothetical protein